MQQIAFIGLGHMGMPMAKNLLKKGYAVNAFDLNSDAVLEIAHHGARACASALEAARESDVVITMLPGGPQVAALYLSEKGLLQTLSKKTIFLDCSTIDIATAHQIHKEAKTQGHVLLDAPVSGGVVGAAAGTLTFMVGGDGETFESVRPILAAMGKNIFHCGAATHGQAAKICNNLMLAAHMIATSEAFNLAEILGLSKEKLFAIASVSTAQSWTLTQYCPAPGLVETSPANYDYKPGFAAAMMLKDIRLALAAAGELSLPLTHEAESIYAKMCVDKGHLDFSAVIEYLKKP